MRVKADGITVVILIAADDDPDDFIFEKNAGIRAAIRAGFEK